MEKEEILKKAESKKALIGEMEQSKVIKANWIALIVTAFAAVAFIITFGIQGNFTALYAVAFICYFGLACSIFANISLQKGLGKFCLAPFYMVLLQLPCLFSLFLDAQEFYNGQTVNFKKQN